MQQSQLPAEPWPAFESEEYGGRMLTAKELQTCVGQLLAAKMHMFTLKVQAIDGVYWRSDDAFKRCAKTRGGAVLDHT